MKWAAISMIVLTAVLAILYSIVGGIVLAIGVGTIGLTAFTLIVFSLGGLYNYKAIQLGAKLVIEAQNNNDRWDTIKMQSLAHFGREIFKLKGQNADGGYPMLGGGDDALDASFTIQGMDEEVQQ